MTKIINLFGGPGSGKSTTAAATFAKMKLLGYNCELVTEFAKQLVWQGRQKLLANNQAYVFGKQLHYLDSVVGQVDYIITDSPIFLSVIYARPDYPSSFMSFVIDIFNRFDNFNIFIQRVKKYNPIGRNQTENEAKEIDFRIKEYLRVHGIPYHRIDGNEEAPENILGLLENLK